MPNAKEIVKGTNKNILVYGPTGTGKTTLFTTIPGKKLLYLFDPSGLDSIGGLDLDYEYFPPDGILGIRATLKGRTDRKGAKLTEPVSYNLFEKHLEEQIEADFHNYDAIGFDSITVLSQILMNRLLFINGRFGRVPELSDYNLLGITLVSIFESVLSKKVRAKTIFVTGHSDLVQDEVSKKIQNQFDITKNVRRMLPRMFSDVWITSTEQVGEKARYSIQTAPSKEYPSAKNSMGLKFMEDVTINLKGGMREKQGIGALLT